LALKGALKRAFDRGVQTEKSRSCAELGELRRKPGR